MHDSTLQESMRRSRTFLHRLVPLAAGLWLAAGTSLCPSGLAAAAEMVLTNEVAVTHWKTVYMKDFAEEISRRTGGKLKASLFPSSQLYDDQNAVAALGTGSVQMVWPVTIRLENIDPRVGIASLPFTLTDAHMTNACFSSGFTRLLSSYMEPRKIAVLGLLRGAEELFVFANRDVRSLAALKGAKVRVAGGKIALELMRALGASPISMAASEMSTALAQGAIDGVFTSPTGWSEMIGLSGRHASYLPGLRLVLYAVVVDKVWFDALPSDHRKAITDAVDQIVARAWTESRELDRRSFGKMVNQGATLWTATPDEAKAWQAAAGVVQQRFFEQYPDTARAYGDLVKACMP